jgi:hypothetical protein
MTHTIDRDQKKLKSLMSDISESCYSAGWMKNLEYVLWDAVINGSRKYGHGIITEIDIDKLNNLSKACNSWIYFDDETKETAINLNNWVILFEKAIIVNPSLLHG